MSADKGDSHFLSPSVLDPEPTDRQKVVLDAFVAEYLKDQNPYAANIRLGFQASFAEDFAKQFMASPYVRRKLIEAELTPEAPQDEERRTAELKKMIEAKLIGVINNGDAKSVVAASKVLATLRGLDVPPDKTGDALQELVAGMKEVAKELPD